MPESYHVKLALLVYVTSGWISPLLVDQLRIGSGRVTSVTPMGGYPNLFPMLTNTLSMIIAWYFTPNSSVDTNKSYINSNNHNHRNSHNNIECEYRAVGGGSEESSTIPLTNPNHNFKCLRCFHSLDKLIKGKTAKQWNQILKIAFFDFVSGGKLSTYLFLELLSL